MWAVGAAAAIPLGAWVEVRRKRAVMMAMDLVRFAAVISVPLAYALGRLSFAHLLVVAVLVAVADNAFRAAAGACLKGLVAPADLLTANRRLEATTWTATALGPPLGGAAIGLLGPVTTAAANAVSYVLSALGHPARSAGPSARPARRRAASRARAARPTCSPAGGTSSATRRCGRCFLNTVLVNGLILATAPLLAVLMLGPLGFAPWQYGLAFGAPCVGGLLGARLAAAARRALRGAARSCAPRARRVPAGRSGSRSSSPARPAWCSCSPSSSASSPASACSTRSSPPIG